MNMTRSTASLACAALVSTLGLSAACISSSGLDPGPVQDDAATDADATAATDVASNPDTSFDAAIPPPPGSFNLVFTPDHVTRDPGETQAVKVFIDRGTAFTDAVDVTLEGQTADIALSPSTLGIPSSGAEASFSINVSGAAATQDLVLTATAVATHDTTIKVQKSLGVRIGSLLADLKADKSVALPPYATSLIVKAWGAGGGAGGNLATGTFAGSGGPGGGGGFLSATISVDPTQPLVVTVGTGGPASPLTDEPTGGGGGGLTKLEQASGALLVVGAGGGGGGASARQGGSCLAVGGSPVEMAGLAGGGGDGEGVSVDMNCSATTTAGGTSGGSLAGGTALHGGDGQPSAKIDGGAPGGGAGGLGAKDCTSHAGGGGGGGGWFGGCGGADQNGQSKFSMGGGGGSGFVIGSATNVVRATGTGATAGGAADSEYANNSGRGGAPGTASTTAPGAGLPGRVILRLPKP